VTLMVISENDCRAATPRTPKRAVEHVDAMTAATNELWDAIQKYWDNWLWIVEFLPQAADAVSQLNIQTEDGSVPIVDIADDADEYAPALRAMGRLLSELRGLGLSEEAKPEVAK
jgi:hypothetical protein